MQSPKFVEILSVSDADDAVLVQFRANDGNQYSALIANGIVSSLVTVLASARRKTWEDYQSPKNQQVTAQPLSVVAARALIQAGGKPALGFLTALGVETVLSMPLEVLSQIKGLIAKMEIALTTEGSKTKQ